MRARKIGNSQLRSFGLIVGAGFALIGVAPIVLHRHPVRMWAVVVAVGLLSTALVFPPALKPVFRVWMKVGETLGWVNSRIILSVVYYALMRPIGAVRRVLGHDAMRRKFDRTSRLRGAANQRPPSHMQQQFRNCVRRNSND